jgi:hypothetical protein
MGLNNEQLDIPVKVWLPCVLENACFVCFLCTAAMHLRVSLD